VKNAPEAKAARIERLGRRNRRLIVEKFKRLPKVYTNELVVCFSNRNRTCPSHEKFVKALRKGRIEKVPREKERLLRRLLKYIGFTREEIESL
jgi:hypothetical protein